ncbi:MAG: alpha-ketoglutarate-dependent dioxygenase AlkB [Pseudomonadota bacterium]
MVMSLAQVQSSLDLKEGVRLYPGLLGRDQQLGLKKDIDDLADQSPYFQPIMPRTGRPFSVTMTNAGPLGWVSDKDGYRYSHRHPVTGQPWPTIPSALLKLWSEVTSCDVLPECCLINRYGRKEARMGLHQDRDEKTFDAPVLSVSLGDSAVFRVGNTTRHGPTQSVRLNSGDVILLFGPGRLLFHGIDRILFGSSTLIPGGGRLNITLRRVTPFGDEV